MKGIENLSCMNFDLTEEQNMFLDQVSRACREIREFEDKAYLERRYNEKIYPILRKAHLLGIPISQIYGGAGADILTYVLATQRLGQEGFSVRTFFSAHISIGQLVIQEFGNEEQKERYLKKTTSGEMIMAFALTEPTSGSDPASLRCKYEDRGDHYVLNGSKCWISNATKAHLITTYAKDKKTKKISAFIMEAESEGYSTEEEKNKMGVVTSDTGSIYFDDCPVPKENLLFEEGKGLNVAFGALMNGRLSVAAGCVGVMEDCLKEAQEYAKQRVQHGKEIAKHQLIQRHIAIISTNLEAAKFLTYRAALAKMDYQEDKKNLKKRIFADQLIAQAKYFASNAAYDAADRAVQIFGANGYSLLNRPARHLCDVRVSRILEGASEVLELKIAAGVLGREFAAFR